MKTFKYLFCFYHTTSVCIFFISQMLSHGFFLSLQMKHRLQIHTHRTAIWVCLHDIRHIIPPFPAMKSLFFKKDAWKIFFSFPHVLQFLYFLFVFLSQANSAIISATCSIFSHRHAFSPQNSSASSVSPLAACTSALVIQYGVSAGLQVAIH